MKGIDLPRIRYKAPGDKAPGPISAAGAKGMAETRYPLLSGPVSPNQEVESRRIIFAFAGIFVGQNPMPLKDRDAVRRADKTEASSARSAGCSTMNRAEQENAVEEMSRPRRAGRTTGPRNSYRFLMGYWPFLRTACCGTCAYRPSLRSIAETSPPQQRQAGLSDARRGRGKSCHTCASLNKERSFLYSLREKIQPTRMDVR